MKSFIRKHSIYSFWLHYVNFKQISEIASSLTEKEIQENWDWLQNNLDCLTAFEREEDVTDFVCCKIRSMIANVSVMVEGKSHASKFGFNFMKFCKNN